MKGWINDSFNYIYTNGFTGFDYNYNNSYRKRKKKERVKIINKPPALYLRVDLL